MSVILTTPVPAPHIPGVYSPSVAVPASSTTQVDAVPLSAATAAKWIVTVTDIAGDRTRMLEVSAVHRDGKPPLHTVFGDVGDRISLTVSVSETSTDFILSIINTDGSDLRVSIMRLQVI